MAAVAALSGTISIIAAASDAAAARLQRGGRLVYIGAGTSGRIAIQDGVELAPTFGWADDKIVFLMAGGPDALMVSVEGAEDDEDAARRDIKRANVGPNDVAITVAASGRTPYSCAALDAARSTGALTIAIANNPDTPLLTLADYGILVDTGSEVVAGSTRMKAGTAQKAALNLLSTAIMVSLGRVYRGRMVAMNVSNTKLQSRATAMIADLAEVPVTTAQKALVAADRDIRRAVLISRGHAPDAAQALLQAHEGNLRSALEGESRAGER